MHKHMKETMIATILFGLLMILPSNVFAQEDHGFSKFDVREDFTENGFQWFNDAELLAAGNAEKSNAMTIGWGGIGTLWGRTALTVYVAEKRYTKEFLDKAEYFIECQIMDAAPFEPKYFKSEVPQNMYARFPAGIHSMYIGEVVNAWKK